MQREALSSQPPERSRVMPLTQARHGRQISLSTAPEEENCELGDSSTWSRQQLILLGVDFYPRRKFDLNRVLRVKETEWSTQLKERVADGVRQLSSVEAADLNRGAIKMDALRRQLAPDFVATFTFLLDIMSAHGAKEYIEQANHSSSQSLSDSEGTARKRPSESPDTSNPSKRSRQVDDYLPSPSESETSDQLPYSSLTESMIKPQNEENTKMLLKLFLLNTVSVLEEGFRKVNWHRSGHYVELVPTQRDTTKFILGTESIVSNNDGGLGLRFNAGTGNANWHPSETRPIFSLKVQSGRSSKEDNMELANEYEGQIFCEMLAQACCRDFFENIQLGYQEAFVMHGSGSSISIYYAKLPNSYLSEIAKYGAKYVQCSPLKQHIILRRTKIFHMCYTAERIDLFKLLSKLLWYLISGRSHVGYLFNYTDNPLHKLEPVVYGSITVETSSMMGDTLDNVDETLPTENLEG